ncbi:MAG TPA: DUF4097 family beta strand repeat-containing protein, partial [Ktedonobacteraceae bacterium]|nr:DUF4097 family beta strand repeat-containing protein [Ktedonobacteraceae bacterium]
DEQQMQFVDPEWRPSDHKKQSVIHLDPREQAPSFEIAPEEYAFAEIPYRERDKLEPQRQTRRRVWFIAIPALLLVICIVLIGALFLPISSHTASSPASLHVQPAQPGIASLSEAQVLPVHDYRPTSSADNEPIVVIKDDVGSVHIHVGGSSNNVTVLATEHAKGANFEGMNVTSNESGPNNNTITITASSDTADSPSRSIDLDITVPMGSSIQLTQGSGVVQIDGMSAEATGANAQVKITSGSVEINGLEGGIDVQSQSAPVILRDLGGTISATTVNGSINATRLSGIVTLNSSTGSIVANDVRWGLTISTGSNGSITVSGATVNQQTLLKTETGNINFQGTIDSGANVQFESSSGAITIALPASSAFQLDFSNISGTLKNDFGSNSVGSGQPAILQITTDSGLVHIQKQ